MTAKKYLFILLLCLGLFQAAFSAPSKDYWGQWALFNPVSNSQINFAHWQKFLQKYLIYNKKQSYVAYAKVSKQDQDDLQKHISNLANIQIENYNRDQQMAYWINLYNMLTVDVILQHKNVTSITQIDKNWIGQSDVWDKPVIKIDGTELTLNNIEHRILRPIWNDPRVHAALNCASISCPNLADFAYNGKNINAQLNKVFSNFINSNKGLTLKNQQLYLSEIFNWYGSDFGTNQQQMLRFIGFFIKNDQIKHALQIKDVSVKYQPYNWSLNAI